jgi:ABC-type Mn2+/Zn2+ transport system ATPase subunit
VGALIEVDGADFGYAGRAVVRDVTLEVQPGEFVAVVGENGSGKTTLLRGLLGLLPALRGRVQRSPGLRIGYAPQRDTLDPLYPLSALDVALLGTYAERPPWRPLGPALRARARTALEACRAGALARRRFGALSVGQRQRVLLARALAVEPQVLLLDEPTAGVDVEAERSILDVLEELLRARGLAIWMVSHRTHALEGRLDRVLRVEDGAVRSGPPR